MQGTGCNILRGSISDKIELCIANILGHILYWEDKTDLPNPDEIIMPEKQSIEKIFALFKETDTSNPKVFDFIRELSQMPKITSLTRWVNSPLLFKTLIDEIISFFENTKNPEGANALQEMHNAFKKTLGALSITCFASLTREEFTACMQYLKTAQKRIEQIKDVKELQKANDPLHKPKISVPPTLLRGHVQ